MSLTITTSSAIVPMALKRVSKLQWIMKQFLNETRLLEAVTKMREKEGKQNELEGGIRQ